MLKPLVWHTPNPTTEGKTRSGLSMSLLSHSLKILVDRVFWHAIGFMWPFVFAVVFIADNFSCFSVSWLLVQLRDRDPYLFTWISYCKMSFKLPGLADKDKHWPNYDLFFWKKISEFWLMKQRLNNTWRKKKDIWLMNRLCFSTAHLTQ